MKQIIIATKNKHKFEEIKSFFKKRKIEFTSLLDHPDLPDIEEDCLSFVGNALKKAKTISQITGQPVLADDSGLCVQALDGRPGVFSARYAGPGATDDQNNQKLLDELQHVPLGNRKAKLVCALVLYLPDGRFYTSLGELSGSMINQYRGGHGFGYDPIFFMIHKNKTLAEVPQEEKIKFSHRTRALENLLEITNNFKIS